LHDQKLIPTSRQIKREFASRTLKYLQKYREKVYWDLRPDTKMSLSQVLLSPASLLSLFLSLSHSLFLSLSLVLSVISIPSPHSGKLLQLLNLSLCSHAIIQISRESLDLPGLATASNSLGSTLIGPAQS
jgi:hypothetical protein